jgi:DNA-binding CsgD family transcriptional regulator
MTQLQPSSAGEVELVRLLEALYDLELPRDEWFRQVLKAASAAFDRGVGVGMLLYDVSGETLRIDVLDGVNLAGANIDFAVDVHAQPEMVDAITWAYRNEVCATMREHVRDAGMLHYLRENYSKFGVGDQVFINGANPDGYGSALYVFSKQRVELHAEERARFTRLAAHLSAAYRLHRRVHSSDAPRRLDDADAILRVDGRVEHATPAVDPGALRELTHAVGRREWAKAQAGRPERGSVAAWKPMVAARWSLVDAYERDGRRYITACENEPARGDASMLSKRERQVASMAALGHSNKLIAYELGLAHSTVRVLLARAGAKLGAHSRSDLIAQLAADRARLRD